MSASSLMPITTTELLYRPRGAARDVFAHRDPEVVLAGPAGTGKSRAALEKLHLALLKHPGARGLMVRKTRRSLSEAAIVTYEQKVLHPLDGVVWRATKQRYEYPNGAILAVGGLDKPGKIMSSEWDIVYVQEATELDEADWEAITTRLRNGVVPYQQVLADCNPDASTHWLRKRMDARKTCELVSVHEDNPVLYDAERGEWTAEGARYLATLDNLSGVRFLRLRRGIWASAEGMVYEGAWDRHANLIDRRAVCRGRTDLQGDCGVPREWPRYLVIDFGYTHPFVCQWYAEDGDGRLYRYRELYLTHRLVEDHAATMRDVSQWGKQGGDPLPRAIICDHDAEDRATLERHLGMVTTPAHKTVSDGIQAVAARFRPAGDSKPRLYYLRDSLLQTDRYLVDAKQPTCTEEEVESYVWQRGSVKEQPVKEFDHGMDCTRYLVAHFDLRGAQVSYVYVPQ